MTTGEIVRAGELSRSAVALRQCVRDSHAQTVRLPPAWARRMDVLGTL